jgi:RimJ/RimL family protein N-acetyltransferase
MILSIDELHLQRHEEPDPQFQHLLNDPGILESMAEARSYPSGMPAKICFRIDLKAEPIGQVCIKNIKWINHKAELSMFIRKDMQGKGYGSSAFRAIITFGFNRLNLYRLEGEVIDGNTASIRLLEQNGFVEEGRLREAKFVNGVYKDLLRFGLLRKEWNG